MATTNIVSFDLGTTNECATTSGTFSVQNSVTSGSWSAYALRANPATTGTGYVRLQSLSATGAAAATSLVAMYCRILFRYDTAPASGDEPILTIGSSTSGGASRDLEVRLDSSGVLTVYDVSLNLLATGATALSSGTWYRLEVKADLSDNTDCVWEVKLDGASEGSGSYANSNGGTTYLFLGKVGNRNGNSVDFYYDDVLISDSAYPGAGRCTLLAPNANGNYQTATIGAGAGSHYQNVDEVPHDSDTTYLVTDGAGGAETEAVSDTAGASISGTINCVKAMCVLKRDGATNGSIKQRRRSGSTDSDLGSAFATTASYTLCASLMDTDPATSLAWSTSGIDGVEVGVLDNSANKTRMTACYLAVDYMVSSPPVQGAPAHRRVMRGCALGGRGIPKVNDSAPISL